MNKNPGENPGFLEFGLPPHSSSATVAHPLSVAISAEKLAESGRIWLKRQFRYRGTAVCALPVTLEHLALKTTSIVLHCDFYFSNLRNSGQNTLEMTLLRNFLIQLYNIGAIRSIR